jgi:hypothetical protein
METKQAYPVLLDNFTVPEEMNPVLSSLFTDTYKITPLETTDECLLGRIDKIKKIKGHYYISSNSGYIIHFNEQGKFVASLNRLGQGPEEYHRIEDFDVYEIEGKIEVWISDNVSIKVYDGYDFSFKYKIPFPFVIHKFKRLENSHILLVTGQSDFSLTIADKDGNIISEYLKREIPFLMFRPYQFIKNDSAYLYQLGISNKYIALNQETETFSEGVFTADKHFLSDKGLLNLFDRYGTEFIREANKGTYINHLKLYKGSIWINTYHAGKNYLTKYTSALPAVSTVYSENSLIDNDLFALKNSSFMATIMDCESDDSILMYIDAYTMGCNAEDNPCIIDFF